MLAVGHSEHDGADGEDASAAGSGRCRGSRAHGRCRGAPPTEGSCDLAFYALKVEESFANRPPERLFVRRDNPGHPL